MTDRSDFNRLADYFANAPDSHASVAINVPQQRARVVDALRRAGARARPVDFAQEARNLSGVLDYMERTIARQFDPAHVVTLVSLVKDRLEKAALTPEPAKAGDAIKIPLPSWLGPDTPENRERLQAFVEGRSSVKAGDAGGVGTYRHAEPVADPWVDTRLVRFDDTIVFGKGGFDFDSWESLRWECHTRHGSFAVWKSGSRSWSLYGGKYGVFALDRYSSESQAKAEVEQLVLSYDGEITAAPTASVGAMQEALEIARGVQRSATGIANGLPKSDPEHLRWLHHSYGADEVAYKIDEALAAANQSDGGDQRCVGGVDPGWDECPKCGATADDECAFVSQPDGPNASIDVEDTSIGGITWHSSEEDGGPDVGISVYIGPNDRLWCGEISRRLFDEHDGPINFDNDLGAFVVRFNGSETTLIAKCADPDTGREFVEQVAGWISRPSGTPPAPQAVEAVSVDEVAEFIHNHVWTEDSSNLSGVDDAARALLAKFKMEGR